MLARLSVLWILFAVFVTITSATFCSNTQNGTLSKRYVSRFGRPMNVTLQWAHDPSRAASALLAVILRQVLGYQHVVLRKTPHLDLHIFSATVPHVKTRRYNEMILALSLAWEPEPHLNPEWVPNAGAVCGLAGPRLEELGASFVPVRQHLHVHVAKKYRHLTQCLNVTQWSFFTNDTAVKECGFTDTASRCNLTKHAVVYELDSVKTSMTILKQLTELPHFGIKNKNRTSIFQMLGAGDRSFLFIDYDIWLEYEHVRVITQPLCLSSAGSTCLLEQSTAVSMRVGDVSLLIEYAPILIDLAQNFTTSPKSIREILEIESKGKNIELAAEEWAIRNNITASWSQKYHPEHQIYDLAIFYCKNDPDSEKYDTFLKKLSGDKIYDLYGGMFKTRVVRYLVDCTNVNDVKNILVKYFSNGIRQRLLGAVVGSVSNITDVASTVEGFELPVVYYDALGLVTKSSLNTWLTTGRTRHLTLALRQFILSLNWKRVAVLSEPTVTAKRFIDDLKAVGGIAFGDHSVPLNLTKLDAKRILQQLSGYENARVILINTNYRDAATILEAGAGLGMNSTKDYAWIVREWRPNNKTVHIKHFALSFWCRCGSYPSRTAGMSKFREKLDILYPNCTWPPHLSTISDAVFTVLKGFSSAILQCPQMRDDLRNRYAIQAFEKSVVSEPIEGLTQNFIYKEHSLEETVVFVDEWQGHWHDHLGRWHVNAATNEVTVEHEQRAAYPKGDQPYDGSSHCYAYSGDPYQPTCHDWEWGTALIFIMLTPPTLVFVYRAVHRRLKEHEKKIIYEVLAQRQKRIAALSASFLVDRSAVSLRHELGSGRFGYVRLAWLRLPGSRPQYVAAKSLRDQYEETEILHEACVLASLHHENIVRLVGVCIDKDPPLLLMEIAFFGDLLQYLRDRRYLAEGVGCDLNDEDEGAKEASNVSAEALTKLARQAASALGYLALRGVIHRDLRASNCLVDANRSLKLADFGLARETKAAGSDGGTEYACRRRGLFPVLWMAPESLINGVFSAASDVWALGVLVFEIVTLGARPFGDMSPLRVMQYVASGGTPSMPRDATMQTVALARLCWQREPDQRPSAADVVAFLAERPTALHPAFEDDNDQLTDTDSGRGESPKTELLPV